MLADVRRVDVGACASFLGAPVTPWFKNLCVSVSLWRFFVVLGVLRVFSVLEYAPRMFPALQPSHIMIPCRRPTKG